MTRAEGKPVDVLIIGAGIAGASLSYFLSERGVSDVLVIERESQPGYHASGRSAATLVELDEIAELQKLKMLGARFLREPPAGFAESPLLERTGVLSLLREPQWSALRQVAVANRSAGLRFEPLTPREASERVGGVLLEDEVGAAAFLPDDGFIDIHELLTGYLRHAKRRGVEFRFGVEVGGIVREGGQCRGVATTAGLIRARRVVNAAGAWVGEIARTAGTTPIEFRPLRRSVAILPAPPDVDVRRWPMVWSDPHSVYFRPESGGLLFCPMDEVPMAPCDASPDEAIIAEGLERLRALAPALVPRTLGRRWAGLRTFSPDRVPVVGDDPALPGFFWLAGQGGCGIETSPALGRIAAELIADGKTTLFDAASLSPARFGAAAP
ncbi:MAG: FAD-binding oxidoreductase [Deltaproteobacteria bacterium]|nr:FAD-binding oxidoreductase [Deltaproteobacteria bacterium]